MTRRMEHAAHAFFAYVAGGGALLCSLMGHEHAAAVLCVLTGYFAAMAAATADGAETREGDGR